MSVRMRSVAIGVVAVFAFLVVCSKADESQYFVEGTIDGMTYRQTGYTEANYVPSYGTQIYASDSSAHKTENINKWYVVFNGRDAGSYPSTQIIIKYYNSASNFYQHNQGLTGTSSAVTITAIGDVGEVIEGTFSGELTDSIDAGAHVLTNGSFKVKRNL